MRRSLRLRSLKSYTYDDAGRTTAVTTSAGTTSLSYDYEGRLTQITYPSTATNTFTYNALDTRVGKVDGAGTATYKRDGVDVTDPVLSDGAAAYTPGISERRSSATKYLHEDFLGSTTRLTDATQATTDTRQYDAFGNLVASTGSTPTPFGFAGGGATRRIAIRVSNSSATATTTPPRAVSLPATRLGMGGTGMVIANPAPFPGEIRQGSRATHGVSCSEGSPLASWESR